jgi:hypothetical protein
MDMPFVELVFADKFSLRFSRNEDGTYGKPFSITQLIELQDHADHAFGIERENPYKEKANETTNPT